MTSKIKVDNINKVSDDSNIIKKCGTTITLGASGDSIALASGASQTGFGRTGTVDWQTGSIKTGTFSAVNGEGYFVDTSSGTATVNLPAGSAGAIVSIADYTGTFATNKCTISANGSEKIAGIAVDVDLTTNGQSVTLVYVDGTEGWVTVNDSSENVVGNPYIVATGGTVTCSGNDKIHTFTGPGTFTITATAACAADNVVSYVVVAGGGGGSSDVGGGGGAGGYREVISPTSPYSGSPLNGYPSAPNRITVSASGIPITVGGGGAGNSYPPQAPGTSGNNSIFSTITSAGGGGGSASGSGADGGSGGGGYRGGGAAGSGNTPPTSPAQGQNGGTGNPNGSGGSGGGGGASAAGATGTPDNSPTGGTGGAGTTSSITASPVGRAGGGGGGTRNAQSTPGGTATDGGGAGSGTGPTGQNATPGTDNTGGGGGGAVNAPGAGGNGGSGVVIIRYRART